MSSGMDKPPVAPKPKLPEGQRPGLSPLTPKKDSLLLPSPGTLRKVKPIPAPKPCLSKVTAAVESNPVSSKSLHQTSVTENPNTQGLLNSQQGVQENKKSAWDYTIPICLCSPENCMCIGDISANKDKTENDLKNFFKGKTNENIKPLPTSRGPTDIHGEKIITRLANHNHLRETFTIHKNLNTDTNTSQALLQSTWSDEANGNKIPQSASGHGPGDDSLGSEQVSRVLQHKPVPPDTRKPLPVPRKPRMAVLTHQEKVDGCLEILHQEGRYMNGTEGKVSSEGKDNYSLSVNEHVETQPVVLSERKGCAMPAAMPRKKHFLSVSAADTQTLSKDVEEEELGWESASQKMEMSVDKVDDEQGKEGIHDQETDCTDFTHCPHSDQQEHSQPPVIAVAAVDVPARVAPKKPQRHCNPRARMEEDGSSKEKEQQKLGDNEKRHDFPIEERVSKERAMRELPLPPAEKTNRNFFTTGAIRPSRTSFDKSRAKSFSAADLIRSEVPKRYSFRKLLDLKLSVKMLPKVAAKGGRNPGCSVNDTEQRIDRDQDGCDDFHKQFKPERTMSCPLITMTQSVDGDELPAGREDIYYENVPYYEEISDYENMHVGGAKTIPCASDAQPTAWQCPEYNDEGIYEEQEPYMSFEKNPVHLQGQRSTDSERSSVDEEVTPLDGGLSNEDTLVITSNDDDDGSSNSSKGDPEQTEQSSVQSEKKQNKILHIANEIMSSESVFVDALKLLHVDFRDEVYRASRQSGKLVIEERLLNQILHYLPQLYELNQDLLRELKLRVAKWDERSQLADIFLNKGHYLKMYSTYISSFDKNVALLEEQSKRNALFGAVVREFEASPRCASLALKHYLLKPIQRIPQYQLLLTDYLKNLTKDSSDYNDTQAALVLVKEVANHANDILKQGDNFQKLMQVQCSLTTPNEIVQPGRKFLKEGILKKLSRKVMQPRMFFLFNDILLHTIPVQSGQYKFKNMWSLAGMKVSKPSQEAYQNELNIESVERSFILSASSATERDEWLDAISTAISAFTRKKFTFASGKPVEEGELQGRGEGAPLGSKAPIWIPDPRTTMCMICTCEFTLTWRRHHCRACGKVVCQNCSSNKHCLEYLKNRLERVCDQCFNVLQQQKSVKTVSAAASTGHRSTFALHRKQKKIPAALKAVTANTDSSMSGYLQRSNGKKQGKRLWFVIKDKVLYTYAASEDVAALESQPLLGFVLKLDSSARLRFQLYHKNTLYYIFKADDIQTAERWIDSFKEATVL